MRDQDQQKRTFKTRTYCLRPELRQVELKTFRPFGHDLDELVAFHQQIHLQANANAQRDCQALKGERYSKWLLFCTKKSVCVRFHLFIVEVKLMATFIRRQTFQSILKRTLCVQQVWKGDKDGRALGAGPHVVQARRWTPLEIEQKSFFSVKQERDLKSRKTYPFPDEQ